MKTISGTTDLMGAQSEPQRSMAGRVLRVVLAAVIFAICCYFAFGVGALLAVWRGASRHVVERDDAAQVDPLAAAMPLAGQWAFDELNWSLKSQLIDSAQLEAEFASLAAVPTPAADAELPDSDPEIIELVTALQIHPTEKMGNQIYRLDRPDLKVQLITRDAAGKSKTVACAIAYPQQDQKWQLFAFTPRHTEAAKTAPTESHLLPLPADARRSGGRFDDDGHVLLELVSVDAQADALLADWREAGWEVRPSGLAEPGAFSYLCARGNDVVYAWSADPPEALKNLMLVRTPTTADTSP